MTMSRRVSLRSLQPPMMQTNSWGIGFLVVTEFCNTQRTQPYKIPRLLDLLRVVNILRVVIRYRYDPCANAVSLVADIFYLEEEARA